MKSTSLFLLALSLAFTARTAAASGIDITVTAQTTNSITLSLGAGQKLVLAANGSPVSDVPEDGFTYNASANFGSGDYVGSSIVVYSGTGTSVVVTGLEENTTYHFAVFEFSGSGGEEVYVTADPGRANATTYDYPSSETTFDSIDQITTTSMRLNLYRGNGDSLIIFARSGGPVSVTPSDGVGYPVNPVFGTSAEIGTGNYAVYSGNGSSVVITGLQPNTTYHFAAYEFNDFSGENYYLTDYFATTSQSTRYYPSTQSTITSITDPQNESMRVYLDVGDGDKRLIVVRSGGAVNVAPVDGTTYSTSDGSFTSGQNLGDGNIAVYAGTDDNVEIYDLNPGTTYHIAVFEFNDFGYEDGQEFYLTADPARAERTTTNTPNSQATIYYANDITPTGMSLEVDKGDGAQMLIIARAGAAVNVDPEDLTPYEVGDDLGGGNRVVYVGSGSTADITGLEQNTTYHFAAFSFNGGSGQEYYLTEFPSTLSETTYGYPAGQGSGITLTEITNTSMRVRLTKGTGQQRLIVVRAEAAVNSAPQDGREYYASGTFMSGDSLGSDENYAVYSGTDSTVTITDLTRNTTYHVAVYEFNEFDNSSSNRFYLRTDPPTASATTTNYPTNQATFDRFEAVTTTGMRLKLFPPEDGGENRIVIARSGAAVSFTPQDGNTYAVDEDLGDGNTVVYVGNGLDIDITGLADSTTYHFAVFEFNGGAEAEAYLIAGAPTPNQMTRYYPYAQASGIVFSEITKTSLRLRVHPGSGDKRLIVARSGAPVNSLPQDATPYDGDSGFTSGDDLGTEGNYAVYAGTDTTVVVTGLQAGVTYHFAVFEYNEFGGEEIDEFYQRTDPATASQATSAVATQAASNVSFTNQGVNSLSLTFTAGDGAQRLILAKRGSAVDAEPVNGVAYAVNEDLGNGNIVRYVGSGSSATLTGLDERSTYHVAVYEFDVVEGEEVYLLTTPARGDASTIAPIPYANLRLYLSADHGVSLDGDRLTGWSDDSGNALADATAPTVGTRPRLVEDVINGKPVVRFADGEFLNLPTASALGIVDADSDIFIVYRSTAVYDDANDIQFLIAGDLGRNELHTNGSGGGGLRFIPNNVGAVNNNSVDGQFIDIGSAGDFTDTQPQLIRLQATDTFGEITVNGKTTVNRAKNSRSSFTGNLRMGRRSDNSFPLFGDIAEILIYNEILGAAARDSVMAYLAAKYDLAVPPTQSASDIVFSGTSATGVTVSVTPGNGERRLIVMKRGSAVDFEPVDGTTYAADAAMGDGNHVVYAGTGSEVAVTGLADGTVYHVAVFEFNGGAGNEAYRRTAPAADSVRTRAPIPYSGLQLLLSADHGTVIESGGLSSWADLSGNDRSATQSAGAYRPTLVEDGINGEPVIRFNGSSSYLILPSTTALGIVDSDYQVFIVARSAAATSSTYYLMATTNQFDHYEIRMNANSGGTAFQPNPSTVITEGATGNYTDGEAHLFEVEATSAQGILRMNRQDITQVNEDSHTDVLTSLVLGTRSGGTFWFDGDIAEVILYNRALSTAERDSVQTYLFAKYAIQNFRNAMATLTGSQGWRLLATPIADSSYASFFNGLWTQGFTGASVSHGAPNVYTWPTTSGSRDSTQWAPLTNASATFHPGSAVLAYIFSDDDGPGNEISAGFPKTLRRSGFAMNGDVDLGARLNPNVGGWSLLGNPYPSNVDWDAFTAANLSDAAYVWDPSTSQWRSWNGTTGGLTDGLIGAFNGFFVETLDASPSLTVPASAQTEGSSVFLGKEASNPIPTIELSVTNGAGFENSSWIQFSETGLAGKDRMDALKLVPLSPEYVQVASFSAAYGKLLDINHLPDDFDRIGIPVEVLSTADGAHTLVFKADRLPEGWSATLLDTESGNRYEAGQELVFTPEKRAKHAVVGADATPAVQAQSARAQRFTLTVERVGSAGTDPETPGTYSLAQNYPNPFNPTTVVGYRLSVDGPAKLTVYDLLGREVAVLVDGPMSAGAHSVTFDASGFSSGVYIYRLQTAQGVLTRKMVLIK